MLCVCTHDSNILLIVHVALLGGGEREIRGEGRDFPLAIECTGLQQEGTTNANRSQLLVSVALLSPLSPFALLVALQKQPVVGLWCFSSLLLPSGAPLLPWLASPGGGGGGAVERKLLAHYSRQSKGHLALRWHLPWLSLKNWPWYCLVTSVVSYLNVYIYIQLHNVKRSVHLCKLLSPMSHL